MRITATLAALGLGLAAASASAEVATFNGTGMGPIPDAPAGAPSCGVNNLGEPRVISFDVTGLQYPVVAVKLSMNIVHSWRGDLVVKLAAPGGSPSKIIFSHTGSNVPNGCGHDGDLNGEYKFSDDALRGWWAWASPVVPPETYRAATPGGVQPGGVPAIISEAFRGVPPSQANGTWTLTFWDAGDGGTGTVNGATLTIDHTDQLFKWGFETIPTTP